MVATSTFLTPAQLDMAAYATWDIIDNQGKRPHMQDMPNRPLMSLIGKKIAMEQKILVGNKFLYNVETESDIDAQEAYGLTPLEFHEDTFGDQLSYDACQIFDNRVVVHDFLEAQGYVAPVGANGKFGGKLSKAQKTEIIGYLKVVLMRQDENHTKNWDVALHGTGSGTYSLAGLPSLFPTDNTTGTIGGKARASNLWARHQATTGLTATAGGTLQTGLDNLLRECRRYSNTGKVDIMLVGSGVLDAVKTYAKNNNLQLNTNISGTGSVDLSIADGAIKWDGIPLIWDPSIDDLISSKTGYALNSSTLKLLYQVKSEFKPLTDEYDIRASRYSLRSKFCLACLQPNANGVFTVA